VGRSTKVATVFVYTKPEAVEKVHRDFLAVGADVIETDTFGIDCAGGYDLADQAYSLNKTAAQLAKRVAAEFSSQKTPICRWVNRTDETANWGILTTIKASFREQATGLYDGGVDLFIVETCQDVLQIKAALNAVKKSAEEERRPIMVS